VTTATLTSAPVDPYVEPISIAVRLAPKLSGVAGGRWSGRRREHQHGLSRQLWIGLGELIVLFDETDLGPLGVTNGG
jgi:hypothetical protein